MVRSCRSPLFSVALVVLLGLLLPSLAWAAPSANVLSLPMTIAQLVAFKIGPGLVVLGVVIGGCCMAFGLMGAVQKCVMAVIGGIVMFAAGGIVDYILGMVQ